MAVNRKKIVDGLIEMKQACDSFASCGVCEIADICTRVDDAVDYSEITPSKILLTEDDY